eukprot:CAMPEP_0115033292 /NCGR_PEP_ID=MMETSP0216-20121206/39754_1 /TAXON_ID=223996 /ORGANISM="Protocruzia adherens, Strain Boccale" /LENGTH=547 /DNA_ID=CAMNT_0002411529 /DNA_START=40 /DNA_END=1683 /DNA_ORIENTATION=+
MEAAPTPFDHEGLIRIAEEFRCPVHPKQPLVGYDANHHTFLCILCIDGSSEELIYQRVDNPEIAVDAVRSQLIQSYCPDHPTDNVGFYCHEEKIMRCMQCIPLTCVKQQHEIIELQGFYQKRKLVLDGLDSQMARLNKNKERLLKEVGEIRAREAKALNKYFLDYIQMIQECQAEALEELENRSRELVSVISALRAKDTINQWSDVLTNFRHTKINSESAKIDVNSLFVSSPAKHRLDSQAFCPERESNALRVTKMGDKSSSTHFRFNITSFQICSTHFRFNITSFQICPNIVKAYDSKYYIAGGRCMNTDLKQIYEFDPWNQRKGCIKHADMPIGRSKFGFVATPDHALYLCGGESNERSKHGRNSHICYRYDLKFREWQRIEDLPFPGSGCWTGCHEDNFMQYCLYHFTPRAELENQILVFNHSMQNLQFPLNHWSLVPRREDTLFVRESNLQGVKIDEGAMLIFAKTGEKYRFTPRNCTLEVLTSDKKLDSMFDHVCGFGLEDNQLLVLGDHNQWAKFDVQDHQLATLETEWNLGDAILGFLTS